MRFILFIFIATFCISISAQSGRISPTGTPAASSVAAELSIKQMFEEANGYNRAKFAEYEQKKIAYSEKLRLSTEREQRQLAAKYATAAATRTNLTGEEIYYVGLLNWIAENYEGTTESLKKFLETPDQKPERAQNARS